MGGGLKRRGNGMNCPFSAFKRYGKDKNSLNYFSNFAKPSHLRFQVSHFGLTSAEFLEFGLKSMI